MNLREDLDILLITYNRKSKLSKMIECIFADNSPIKDCSITFLDNCSTDGTSEMLAQYAKDCPNVTHIRHEYNIGGNANIVRAYETADRSKKYFWILCDDDYLDWTHWGKIEAALESGEYDIVQVHSDEMVQEGTTFESRIAKSIVELVLVPAGIYKTRNITSDMIFFSYVNIYTKIPHMSLITSVINAQRKIYHCNVTEQVLIKRHERAEFGRGVNLSVTHTALRIDLPVGFAISLSMLKNPAIKSQAIELSRSYLGWSFSGYIRDSMYGWIHNHCNDDIIALYNACDDEQKKRIYEMIYQIQYYQSKLPKEVVVDPPPPVVSPSHPGIKASAKMIIKGVILLVKAIFRRIGKTLGVGWVNH